MTPASLLSWRSRLGLNKTEAAKALGLSRNGYDYYETGRYRIPLHIALACAAVAHGLPPISDPPSTGWIAKDEITGEPVELDISNQGGFSVDLISGKLIKRY